MAISAWAVSAWYGCSRLRSHGLQILEAQRNGWGGGEGRRDFGLWSRSSPLAPLPSEIGRSSCASGTLISRPAVVWREAVPACTPGQDLATTRQLFSNARSGHQRLIRPDTPRCHRRCSLTLFCQLMRWSKESMRVSALVGVTPRTCLLPAARRHLVGSPRGWPPTVWSMQWGSYPRRLNRPALRVASLLLYIGLSQMPELDAWAQTTILCGRASTLPSPRRHGSSTRGLLVMARLWALPKQRIGVLSHFVNLAA